MANCQANWRWNWICLKCDLQVVSTVQPQCWNCREMMVPACCSECHEVRGLTIESPTGEKICCEESFRIYNPGWKIPR